MSLIYIGFTKINGLKHSCTTPAAIAQSDFTYKLLSEITDVEYYYCLDHVKNNRKKNKKLPIQIRLGFFSNILDCFYLLVSIIKKKNVKRIILYHSLLFSFLAPLLRLAGKNVTLQLNEIYSNEYPYNTIKKKILEKILIWFSNDYILSTTELIRVISKKNLNIKKIPIIPGPIYFENLNKKKNFIKKKNTILKLVYSGVIDKSKIGGAFMAVELAKLLNDKQFEIFIYGFGEKKNVISLINKIKESNKKTKTKSYYKGNLDQALLVKTLKKYNVGLAIQQNLSYAKTSFPSKILTYLSSGLLPVFSDSRPIRKWVSSNNVGYIYKKNNMHELASYLKKIEYINHRQISAMPRQIYKNIEKNLSEFL
jgi:hypothetical protein